MIPSPEMHERNKWAFWIFVAAGLVIICVPSGILLESVGRYERFLSGFEPSPLRPMKVHGTPRHDGAGEPAFEFVDFRLVAPKAKKVSLIGDFNAWKAGSLPMAKTRDGAWELTLPLPKGRYHYRFDVDGEEKTDPENKDNDDGNGKTASVKVIP